MSKILETLAAELTALRQEIATLKTSAPSPSRRPSGKRVAIGKYFRNPAGSMAFQDWCLAQNATWHLTDAQLSQLFTLEYEDSWTVPVTIPLVRVIRRLFNEGRHSKDCKVPTTPSVEYLDTDHVVVNPDSLVDPDARRD